MTLMLASVTNPAEAEAVWVGGADIIDLKDPAKGALGALDADVAAGIVRSVGKRKPVSAAAGASLGAPWAVVDAVAAIAATGVDYVKVGFSSDKSGADCVRALGPHASNTKLVGVLFADCAPDLDMLALMANNGFTGAMLDTAKKGAGRLLDHMDVAALDRFIDRCRENGLTSGLAGSLEAPGRTATSSAAAKLSRVSRQSMPRAGARGRDRRGIREDDPGSHSARSRWPRADATRRGSIGASCWDEALFQPTSESSRPI